MRDDNAQTDREARARHARQPKLRVVEIYEDEYHARNENLEGYCVACRAWTADGVEPDARGYVCPVCRALTVYGAEELLLRGCITFVDEEG